MLVKVRIIWLKDIEERVIDIIDNQQLLQLVNWIVLCTQRGAKIEIEKT
jgi:hypothetical protein